MIVATLAKTSAPDHQSAQHPARSPLLFDLPDRFGHEFIHVTVPTHILRAHIPQDFSTGLFMPARRAEMAIAENILAMMSLKVPVIALVIGEGGSGGALAIGVCDRLVMLQYSVYSVISPEGCASILWKSADRRELAAEAMGITADRLSKLNLVDEVLAEPLGGAHREPQTMAERLREALARHVGELAAHPLERLLEDRRKRLRGFGVFGGS